MFSGICVRSGIAANLPVNVSGFHSTYSQRSPTFAKELVTTSNDFDFSLTATVSEIIMIQDGILQISPFTKIC